MIQRLTLLLGQTRLRALFLLIAGTGLASLILNAAVNDYDWVRPVQSLLVVLCIGGALIIVGSALDPGERGRWVGILLPAVGLLVLGLTVLPQLLLPLLGGALGWVVAGVFIFRPKTRMEYQRAVRHLRRNEYAEAVRVMDELIKDEPKDPQHYRFRAELLRLWGKLDRARRDYTQMTKLDPTSAVAYNGLAEVNLQAGDYDHALEAAQRACELLPGDWVALYNLGMIEDRLRQSSQVIDHLTRALALKVPDARHRLLMRFYLARAHVRLGNLDAAKSEVEIIKKQRSGLREWRTLLDSDQATTLRAVLGDDVQAAEALADGTIDVSALTNGSV